MTRAATLVAGVVLAAWALAAASTSAAFGTRDRVPGHLVGTWGKTLTADTWKRNSVTYEPAGRWSIVITSRGLTSIFIPPGRPSPNPLTTMHVSASGTSVVFGPTADGFCPGNATYRWSLSGTTLRFTVVKEDCTARRILISAGAWARR